MNIDAKTILQAASVVTAIGVLGSAAWAVGDYTQLRPALLKELRVAMDQTQQNSLATIQLEFKYLQDKMKFGELTFEEKQIRCKDAQILGYSQVDGCFVATGEPQFVQRSTVR